MCKECRKVDLGFTSEKYPQGTHICLIYNDEQERKKVISKFLKSGIEAKEKVSYFSYDTGKEEITDWIKDLGINITKDEIDIQKAIDTYCPEGVFDPHTMIELLRNFYNKTVQDGYPGCRATGEMVWALQGIPGSDRLMEYEALLNRVFESHPIVGICQYDARKFDGATILNCIKVHPYMIVHNQIIKNPYYLSAEEYLAEKTNANKK